MAGWGDRFETVLSSEFRHSSGSGHMAPSKKILVKPAARPGGIILITLISTSSFPIIKVQRQDSALAR